jgi:hypothetical protein
LLLSLFFFILWTKLKFKKKYSKKGKPCVGRAIRMAKTGRGRRIEVFDGSVDDIYLQLVLLLSTRIDLDGMGQIGRDFLAVSAIPFSMLMGEGERFPSFDYRRDLPKRPSFHGGSITKTLVDRAISLFMGSDVSGLRLTLLEGATAIGVEAEVHAFTSPNEIYLCSFLWNGSIVEDGGAPAYNYEINDRPPLWPDGLSAPRLGAQRGACASIGRTLPLSPLPLGLHRS